MLEKVCTKCRRQWPADDKHFGHTKSGNLRGECRECVKARQTTPQARILHRNRAQQRRDRGGDEIKLSRSDKERLYDRQNGLCPCCAEAVESIDGAETDHVKPLSKGGDNSWANLILVHAQCNREKHNKTLVEHWDWRFKMGKDKVNLRTILT